MPAICRGEKTTYRKQLFDLYLKKHHLIGSPDYMYWDQYILEEMKKRNVFDLCRS